MRLSRQSHVRGNYTMRRSNISECTLSWLPIAYTQRSMYDSEVPGSGGKGS